MGPGVVAEVTRTGVPKSLYGLPSACAPPLLRKAPKPKVLPPTFTLPGGGVGAAATRLIPGLQWPQSELQCLVLEGGGFLTKPFFL